MDSGMKIISSKSAIVGCSARPTAVQAKSKQTPTAAAAAKHQ